MSSSNHHISFKNVSFKLKNDLSKFDLFLSKPFIVFEKNNFLDDQNYKKLVDEIYMLNDFDFAFPSQKGGKLRSVINGGNVKAFDDGVFKNLCLAFLSNQFYKWFLESHLHYFQSNILRFRVNNPNSIFFRILLLFKKFLHLPISFFATEVEFSSIKKGSYIPPHTDTKHKRLSFVYYLPHKDKKLENQRMKSLGTVFWEPKNVNNEMRRFDCNLLTGEERDTFYERYTPFYVSNYEENKLTGFIKSDISWHSVEKFYFEFDRRALVINIFEY